AVVVWNDRPTRNSHLFAAHLQIRGIEHLPVRERCPGLMLYHVKSLPGNYILNVFPFGLALFQESAQAFVGISALHHPCEVEGIDLAERFQAVLMLFLSHAYTGFYKVQGDGAFAA